MQQNISYHNMTAVLPLHSHFPRPRIELLLEEAVTFPLIFVTAGAGYGKTQAISTFLDNRHDITPIYLHLSRLDNFSTKFWDNFVAAVNFRDVELASNLCTMGFPDSLPRFHRFIQNLSGAFEDMPKPVLVFDDFSAINAPLILQFVESLLSARLKNVSVILIGRTMPQLNLPGYYTENLIYQITENDLCFTPEEAAGYFNQHGMGLTDDDLRKIYAGTEGWISAIYLVLLSLKSEQSTAVHALTAAKPRIFELIEHEIFNGYSPEVQKILVKLSFLESTSFNMKIADALSKQNVNLIREIEQSNQFIHFDPRTQSYSIHHLFKEFLFDRQRYCTKEEIHEAHYLVAQWYHGQGSIIEALGHYQKCGNYEEIWDIIRHSDIDLPQEEAMLFLDLIEEFPEALLTNNPFIGIVQGRLLLNNGRLAEAENKLSSIKERFEALPETPENRAVLGEACIFLAMLSLAMRNYNFVELFKTADQCLPDGSSFVNNRLYMNNGNYAIPIEAPVAHELEKFENAVICAMPYASRVMNGCCYGAEYLTLAESGYFTNHMDKAESNAYEAIYKAQHEQQNDLVCVAYSILMRVHIAKGNYSAAAGFLTELKGTLQKRNHTDCLYIIDVIEGWFFSRLGDLAKVPDWITVEDQSASLLSPNRTGRDRLLHAYCLLESGHYYELLAFSNYLEAMYNYKGFLLPKIQVQIFKCIAAQKIHDTEQSVAAFEKAYELAYANSLIMPFIELGKYMRAVCDEVRQYEDSHIPRKWLDTIYAKANTYAKHLHHVRSQYQKTFKSIEENPYNLTDREKEVLQYLCQGLTRKEIADNLYLSMGTVKRVLKNIYNKMGASNGAEAAQLATQSGLN